MRLIHVALLLCTINVAHAQAFSRDTVVETQLAPRAVKQHVARLQSQAATANAAERISNARRLIEASRSTGDPRLLGYAQAQLDGAVDGLDLPDALVLRATIEQAQHRFDSARTLLDRALLQQPQHLQARLTRANVALVQAKHADARRDCAQLPDVTIASICAAQVAAATGANQAALTALNAAARNADAATRAWALSLAGDVLVQEGRPDDALRDYAASLSISDDLYTRIALADALLAANQPQRVAAVLAQAPATDAVLLRRWIAAARSKTDAGALAQQLRERFAIDAARGTQQHAREAALFALEEQRVADAVQLARANWQTQREVSDARLLAQAARAARDETGLNELRLWLRNTGLRDAQLMQLLNNNSRGGV